MADLLCNITARHAVDWHRRQIGRHQIDPRLRHFGKVDTAKIGLLAAGTDGFHPDTILVQDITDHFI